MEPEMKKFTIRWNVGYGEMTDNVEAEDLSAAMDMAYEAAREDFENYADYSADEGWEEE
jgi:hypothetical protein